LISASTSTRSGRSRSAIYRRGPAQNLPSASVVVRPRSKSLSNGRFRVSGFRSEKTLAKVGDCSPRRPDDRRTGVGSPRLHRGEYCSPRRPDAGPRRRAETPGRSFLPGAGVTSPRSFRTDRTSPRCAAMPTSAQCRRPQLRLRPIPRPEPEFRPTEHEHATRRRGAPAALPDRAEVGYPIPPSRSSRPSVQTSSPPLKTPINLNRNRNHNPLWGKRLRLRLRLGLGWDGT
jgi:hypothetical protein